MRNANCLYTERLTLWGKVRSIVKATSVGCHYLRLAVLTELPRISRESRVEGGRGGALSPESYDNEIYWCSQYKMRVGERSSQMCQPEARRHDAHKSSQFCSQINIVPDGGFTTCGDFIITATPQFCLRSSSSTRFMLLKLKRGISKLHSVAFTARLTFWFILLFNLL